MHDGDPNRAKADAVRDALGKLRSLATARGDVSLIAGLVGPLGPARTPWVQVVTSGANAAELRALANELLVRAREAEAAEQQSVADPPDEPSPYWWRRD